MQRRYPRGIKGFALFYVNKDIQVVKIDFLIANITLAEYKPRNYMKEYRNAFDEMTYHLGEELSGYFYEDTVCYVKSKLIACRFFYSPENDRVVYVMFATLYPGIIRIISRRLEKMGWKRRLLIEFSSIKQRMK
ncbi:MAG: hypothetical protein DRJ37_01820 [Thermoprotei archaeon]|nr:MAG: hypothetical protein DRJ37_01820 [Thermoprotei archaeon]